MHVSDVRKEELAGRFSVKGWFWAILSCGVQWCESVECSRFYTSAISPWMGSQACRLWKWAIDNLCHLWICAGIEKLWICHDSFIGPSTDSWPHSQNRIPVEFCRNSVCHWYCTIDLLSIVVVFFLSRVWTWFKMLRSKFSHTFTCLLLVASCCGYVTV